MPASQLHGILPEESLRALSDYSGNTYLLYKYIHPVSPPLYRFFCSAHSALYMYGYHTFSDSILFHLQLFPFCISPLKQQKQSPISTHGSLSSIHRVFSDLYIYAYSQKSVLNCSGFTPDFIKLIFPNQTTPGYSFFQVYHFDKFMSINVRF